jgi:hypothetical protein
MKRSLSFLALILFVTMLSGCIISMTPKGDQTLCPNESMTFSVGDLAQGLKAYEWTLDGVPIIGSTAGIYTYTPTPSEVGSHILKVQIEWDSRSWNVEVLNCGTVGLAKILFCVDTSGNMLHSDPLDKRVSAVKETINKFYDNANVSFGIIDFDNNAKILTGFTRDRTLLEDYADSLGDDYGWTTYLAGGSYTPGALDTVDQVIDETETGNHFVVIFIGDGEPTQGTTGHDPIVDKVTSIAVPGNVKLYTIYLNGDPLPSAEQLLNDMAIAGKTSETHVYTDPSSLSFIELEF